jgi:hypothetical protein
VESGEEILGTGSQNAGLWGIAMALEAFMGVHGPGLGDWRLQHPDRHTGCGTSHSQPGPLGDSSQGDLELTLRDEGAQLQSTGFQDTQASKVAGSRT